MSEFSTYSPDSVILTIGGAYVVGWNSFAISRDSSEFTTIKGIRGKHTRVRSYDTAATIVVELPFSSEWNDIFSEIVTQDSVSATGRLEVFLKDNSGRSLFKSTQAFVTRYADVTFDATISSRVWQIQCLSTDVYIVGGSSNPSASLLSNAYSNLSDLFS